MRLVTILRCHCCLHGNSLVSVVDGKIESVVSFLVGLGDVCSVLQENFDDLHVTLASCQVEGSYLHIIEGERSKVV